MSRIFETAHEISLSCAMYDMTVTQFGNVDFLFKTPLTFDIGIFFTGTLTFIVQFIFTYRVSALFFSIVSELTAAV
jgi:hypothetical protein